MGLAAGLLVDLDPALLAIVRRSLFVSASATAVAALLGLPLGAWLAVRRLRLQGLVLLLLNTLLALPSVVVGLLVYRELKLPALPHLMLAAAKTSSVVMFLVATALVSAWLITIANIPGEVTAVVTTLDGHQMARKGQAGRALSTAAIGSFIAGTLGISMSGLADRAGFVPP